MKKIPKQMSGILVSSLVVFLFVCLTSGAQEFSRSGKSEVFGSLQSMSGDSATAGSLKLEIDDSMVFGIGYGYNINDYLNFNADMLFGSTDVEGTLGSISVQGDTTLVVMDLNLEWNLLKSNLTPMIGGGLGVINFSGDFSGYDFSESDFSYNLVVGFRWDVSDHFLLKGGYRATWTEIEDTDEAIMLDGITLSAGYVF